MVFAEKRYCTGCSACYNICPENCIQMLPDNEGFVFPEVADKRQCVNCNLCSNVCPLEHPKAYAAMNLDENIRGKSTSGGLFHLFAEHIISQGGIVFGAKFDAEYCVIHGSESTVDGIEKFRGSKYVQSAIGETFKECKVYLESGKAVLFSGTPCQIRGLLVFLDHDYENLFCVDFICMSVPSPRIWKQYVNWQKEKHGSIPQKIAFRHKNPNWKQSSMRIDFDDGQVYMSVKDPFRQIFGSEVAARNSCYNCRFRTLNRDSDITIADFWGIEKICPEMDDTKGTSLVLINTPKGKGIFEKVKVQCKIKPVSIHGGIKYNQRAIKSREYDWKKLEAKRVKLFQNLDILSFEVLVKKCVNDPILIRGCRFTRRCLGKIKGKLWEVGTSLNKR